MPNNEKLLEVKAIIAIARFEPIIVKAIEKSRKQPINDLITWSNLIVTITTVTVNAIIMRLFKFVEMLQKAIPPIVIVIVTIKSMKDD